MILLQSAALRVLPKLCFGWVGANRLGSCLPHWRSLIMSSRGNAGPVESVESLGNPDVMVEAETDIASRPEPSVEALLTEPASSPCPPSPRLGLRRGLARENFDHVMMAEAPATGQDVAEGPLPVAHAMNGDESGDVGNEGSTSTDMDLDVEPGPGSESSSPSDPNVIPVMHSSRPLPDPTGGRFLTVTFVSTTWSEVTIDLEGRAGPAARANSWHRVTSHQHGGW